MPRSPKRWFDGSPPMKPTGPAKLQLFPAIASSSVAHRVERKLFTAEVIDSTANTENLSFLKVLESSEEHFTPELNCSRVWATASCLTSWLTETCEAKLSKWNRKNKYENKPPFGKKSASAMTAGMVLKLIILCGLKLSSLLHLQFPNHWLFR